ncbi:unnamed protein product [Clonostachys rosea f. rosea IK726]|jgi:hypothetical protein|uniref:Uncharacterized protein n=2 Tax=Bionectria ochroleuca TaxID=29856 RepID=A0A8H7N6E4_BIOOC|nr:unnamed protein product [Clonostachys rosea f. rosea IK726]
MDGALAAKEMPRMLFPRRFSSLTDMTSLNIDEAGVDQGDPNGAMHLYISIALVILLFGLFGAVSLFLHLTWSPERATREVCLDRCERGMEERRAFLDQDAEKGEEDFHGYDDDDLRRLAESPRPRPQPKIAIRITAP